SPNTGGMSAGAAHGGTPSTPKEWGMQREQLRGQAMVEFSLVVGLFLICLLGAVSASVYTLQRSAAITGVAAGAPIAPGGTTADAGGNNTDVGEATTAGGP